MVPTQNRYVDQWNRIKDPDKNACSYRHLIFDKNAKYICQRKEEKNLFNKWCCENQYNETRFLSLTQLKKINLKWIKSHNVRLETTKGKGKENALRYKHSQGFSE